jgi:hypothetical protein
VQVVNQRGDFHHKTVPILVEHGSCAWLALQMDAAPASASRPVVTF